MLRRLPRRLGTPLADSSCPCPLIMASACICSRDPEVLPSEPRLSEPGFDPPLLYPPCHNPQPLVTDPCRDSLLTGGLLPVAAVEPEPRI